MKTIQKIIALVLLGLSLSSCEKDNITNDYIDQNPERMTVLAADFRKALSSAEKGWVMMVKSNLNEEVYTPVVMRFDTATNRVYLTTVYGTTNQTEDFFRITSGTGAPQLIFTTGSIISTLYRVGPRASDLTDHIFNLISIKDDELVIQAFRSGNSRSKEGGVIYKLFKRPLDWTWADDPILFDYSSPPYRLPINNVVGRMTFEYLSNNTTVQHDWKFWNWAEASITTLRTRDPFSLTANIGTGGFMPAYYYSLTSSSLTNGTSINAIQGKNAVVLYPFTSSAMTDGDVIKAINKMKTYYLVLKNEVRQGNNVKMDFESYDKDGKVIVKAHFNNLR